MTDLGNVNEKTSATLTLDFTDENGAPVTPTSGNYRIDTFGGTAIRAPTSIAPTSSHHQIALSVADNTLVDTSSAAEPRAITVTWTYGSNKQGTAEYMYTVLNLKYIA